MQALGAGEKEYVEFAGPCKCEGAVELWLQTVVDAMREALSAEYKAAVVAYDEKPRGKWLFDQSVQTTITTSRTFFTQEVNSAFNDMEDGKEDALKARIVLAHAQPWHLKITMGSQMLPACPPP